MDVYMALRLGSCLDKRGYDLMLLRCCWSILRCEFSLRNLIMITSTVFRVYLHHCVGRVHVAWVYM